MNFAFDRHTSPNISIPKIGHTCNYIITFNKLKEKYRKLLPIYSNKAARAHYFVGVEAGISMEAGSWGAGVLRAPPLPAIKPSCFCKPSDFMAS